jgi:hypothetical protein
MARQEMLPDEIKAQLPKLYSQEENPDPTVHLKLFTPWSSWSWFITEGELLALLVCTLSEMNISRPRKQAKYRK